jgi:hypothetical protein
VLSKHRDGLQVAARLIEVDLPNDSLAVRSNLRLGVVNILLIERSNIAKVLHRFFLLLLLDILSILGVLLLRLLNHGGCGVEGEVVLFCMG